LCMIVSCSKWVYPLALNYNWLFYQKHCYNNVYYNFTDHYEVVALRKCSVYIFSQRDSMLRQPNLSCRNTSTTGVNLASVEENNYYSRGFEHKDYNNNILVGVLGHKYSYCY
jgi:hypothetical protein